MGNGQVLGVTKTPTSSDAQGVWSLQDLYNARLVDAWPSVIRLGEQGLVDFIYINAKDGITGDVFNYVPPYPVGDAGTGNFTASSSTSYFTLTNHRLAVGDQVKFVEGGGALPDPIVEGQVYYVESVPTADTFTVSGNDGGLVLPLTSNGTADNDRRVFKYPLENDPSGGFNVEVEIFHYDLASYPAGLTVTTTLRLGENADKPERITAVVVDGNFTISGGTIGVTNDRNRLGFAVLSRANVDVGGGRGIVQPPFTLANETDNSVGKFRHWRITSSTPFANGYVLRGGNGGNMLIPPNNFGGGAGGAAFGGTAGTATANPNPSVSGLPGVGTQGGRAHSSPALRAGGGGGGGSPVGSGGPAGGVPGSPGSLPDGAMVFIAGNNITIPPTGVVGVRGGAGGAGSSVPFYYTVLYGYGGGGAGGGLVGVYHAGTLTNSGSITAAGGSGGPSGVGAGSPGGAGNVITAPIPSDVLNS